MVRQHSFNLVIGFCASVFLTGCMPKMTIEELKAMKPERPAELDKLDAFVGTWKSNGKMVMGGLDQPLETSATSDVKWSADRGYVVGHATYQMEAIGEMKGMEIWTYDVHADRYRTAWVDDMGGFAVGEAWYDERTDTWEMKATSYTPHGKSIGKGSVKFIDENTQEWSWREYVMGGLIKVFEMSGVAERQ